MSKHLMDSVCPKCDGYGTLNDGVEICDVCDKNGVIQVAVFELPDSVKEAVGKIPLGWPTSGVVAILGSGNQTYSMRVSLTSEWLQSVDAVIRWVREVSSES